MIFLNEEKNKITFDDKFFNSENFKNQNNERTMKTL